METLVKVGDIHYRYDQVFYSVTVDAEREIYGSRQELKLSTYEVTKITPKGYWVKEKFGVYYGDTSFILAYAKKKKAYPSLFSAQISFIGRKRSQINILKKQLCNAEAALQMMKLKINSEY